MFSTTRLQSYSSAVFLLALVLSDLVVMAVEVLDDVAEIAPNTTAGDLLYGYNDWRCRVTTFVYQTARTVSSWLVVALSVEMCLVGSDPKRSKGVYLQSPGRLRHDGRVSDQCRRLFPFPRHRRRH